MKLNELFEEPHDVNVPLSGGRAAWDPHSNDYLGDYSGSKNWGAHDREDDEHHHLDTPKQDSTPLDNQFSHVKPWWYIRLNGEILDEPNGDLKYWLTKDEARQAGKEMLDKNPDDKIVLTTNPF